MDDEHKKEYCSTQFDMAEDKQKELQKAVEDSQTAIANADEGIATLKDEIDKLQKGIKDLDKSVVEATEQRKEESADYQSLMASDSAAKELLNFAKNRLNKFYNPKLYKSPPKQELTEQERLAVNMGGEAPTTPAPGGIAGTGVTVFAQISRHTQAVPEKPATWEGGLKKKGEESTGVIAMIDMLIKDLDKEMTEAQAEEKNGQKDYEAMMGDSAKKRAQDSKSLTEKGVAKAELESDLESHKESVASLTKELMATGGYIQSLHGECDWLLQYFDVRKEARTSEIESLGNAKAVLQGADYASLLQTRNGNLLRRSA
jgi:septal ring factor EnvC (AmiA/AmiB activator)